MISVGIDVSKGKSTVCILKPYGEIMCSPFEMLHGEKELNALDDLLNENPNPPAMLGRME